MSGQEWAERPDGSYIHASFRERDTPEHLGYRTVFQMCCVVCGLDGGDAEHECDEDGFEHIATFLDWSQP